MTKLIAAGRFVLLEFGPLAAFVILSALYGVKVAIAGSIVAIALDAAWRLTKGLQFTRLYLLTTGLTVVFGGVDLMSATPFMLKYEPAVTNIVTGAAFVIGALGDKPLIQDAAEQQRGRPFAGGAEIRRFFQIFTLIWAGYFLLKAGFYYWTALRLPMVEAIAVRSAVGGASLAAMATLSVTQGRRLFALCHWLGLLPPPAPSPQTASDNSQPAGQSA